MPSPFIFELLYQFKFFAFFTTELVLVLYLELFLKYASWVANKSEMTQESLTLAPE